MAARERDRLNTTDAAFLAIDDGAVYATPGFLFTVAGGPPRRDELLRRMALCVEQMPRLRQRVRRRRIGLGRPEWIDDPSFRLDWHVRRLHVANRHEWGTAVEQIFSQRLDETKPLWELWVLSGDADDRFSLIFKTHHCLGDGVSFGHHFTSVLLDGTGPAPGRTVPAPRDGERHRPRLRDRAIGLGQLALTWLPDAGPDVPALNGPLSPHRRLLFSARDLEGYLAAKATLGGTVNDVFLTALSGALARWLETPGALPADLRVGVAASTRAPGEESSLGNEMSLLRLVLPLAPADPVARHAAIVESTSQLKGSRQLAGVRTLALGGHAIPGPLLGPAMRLQTSKRFFNLVASNLPGPREPASLLGRDVLAIHPCNILLANQRLIVTLMTYAGKACVTFVADAELLGLKALQRGFDRELDELAGVPGRGAAVLAA